MGSEAIIIGEVLVGIIQFLAIRAKIAGLKEEEVNRMIDEAVARVKASNPQHLPDV